MKQLSYVFKKVTLIIVLIILGIIVSGQQQATFSQSEKDMQAMVEQLLELWNKGNLALADELYIPDIIRHAVDIFEDISGIEAYKEWVKNTRTQYPDFNVKTEELIVKDDRIIWRWTVTGTNKGPIGELPPTGKKIQFSGVTISKVTNGKITEQWFYWNAATVLTQLGYTITPPSTTEEK